MATVDSLDIQISAEVKKASASIDSLVKKVDRLSASLSGVNSRGLATLGSGVNKLSNAMSNFSKNTKISDFTRLANSLKQLNGVNVQSLNSISPAIQNIANSMNAIGGLNFGNNAKQVASMVKALGSLNKINPSSIKNATNAIGKMAGAMNGIKGMNFGDNPTKIAELARSISNLGGKSATNAIKNIPLLASAMRNLMQTLSTAPKVSNNLIQMTNALAKFARTGSSGGRAANSLSNSVSSMAKRFNSMPRTFNMFNKSISSSIFSMNGLRSSLSSVLRTYLGFYAIMRGLKNSIDISSDITEVQNVVDVTFGKYAKKVEELSKTSIQDFGMSELTVKQVASRFQAMGTAMGYSQKNMSDMSVELTKLTADMASFYNVEQKDVAEDLESIFTGQTRPLRTYGLDLTQATLQEWAMKQGIDANMKSMSQMQKTMLRYQYVMANSKQAQGDFIRTQNTWANQIRILKENFKEFQKVIGNILINTLKPLVKAFNLAMLEITAFSETVMNALGKIFGWTYEKGGGSKNPASDMADSMEDVVGATEDATKAQKEFNKQLGTFDELNNYTTNETGGGSGDGGGSGTGVDLTGGENGEWKQKDSVFKKFQSEINSLYELGSHIGETLSSAMLSIDWDSVYQKASNFGTGLANFLNGLISPKLFGATGATIANALNTALTSLNSFGETFDWVNFGNSIANGINNFFKNFDFKLLAETLNTWATGLLDSLVVAVEGIEWGDIAQKIADGIKEIDASGISWRLGKLANSLANALYDIVSTADLWKNMGTKIGDGINGFFKGMNEIDKESGLTGWQTLGKTISTTFSGIANSITTALDTVEWETIGQSIADFITSIDWKDMVFDFAKLADKAFDSITDAIAGFAEKAPLETAIIGLFAGLKLTGLGAKLSSVITTALAGKNLTLGKVALGLGLGLATFKLSDSDNQIKKYVMAPLTAFFAAKTFGVSAKISLTIAALVGAVNIGFDLGQALGSAIQDYFSEEDMSQYRYKMKWSDFLSYDTEEWLQGMADWIVDVQDQTKEMFDAFMDDVISGDWKFTIGELSLPSYNEWTTSLSEWWTGVQEYWGEKVLTVKSNIADFKDAFNLWWDDVKTWWKDKGLTLKTSVASIKDGIKKKWETAKSWWKDKVKLPEIKLPKIADIKNAIKKAWDSAKSWASEKFKLPEIKFPKIKSDTVKKWLSPIVEIMNKVIGGINSVLKIESKSFKAFGKEIKFDGFTIFEIPKIKGYATGGFPEDGWFRASHGELMGQFDNGQTVVANNMQITEGISSAVRQGNQAMVSIMSQELNEIRRQNEILLDILAKETGISADDVFGAVRNKDSDFRKRTGHSAFAY